MASLFGIALLSIGAASCSECVDLIEVNHVYAAKGTLAFSQVIFWDRNQATQRHEVRAWRIIDAGKHPCKSETSGLWSSEWIESGRQYRVTSRQYRESWTMGDPEVDDRKKHPIDERRELFSGRQLEIPK